MDERIDNTSYLD